MGGRIGIYGDLHLLAPKYCREIHYGATYSGPFPGGVAESGITGPSEVFLAVGTGLCGSEVGM